MAHNVHRFHILKFTYFWHKGLLPKLLSNYFQNASNVHSYNTRYALKQNLYAKKVRTNTGKQTIGYAACIVWNLIPSNLKELRGSLPKTGPLRFGSESQFPLNFAHEYILVQK